MNASAQMGYQIGIPTCRFTTLNSTYKISENIEIVHIWNMYPPRIFRRYHCYDYFQIRCLSAQFNLFDANQMRSLDGFSLFWMFNGTDCRASTCFFLIWAIQSFFMIQWTFWSSLSLSQPNEEKKRSIAFSLQIFSGARSLRRCILRHRHWIRIILCVGSNTQSLTFTGLFSISKIAEILCSSRF